MRRKWKRQIKVMKAGKAGGPSEVVGEMLKAAGKKGIKRLTELCNQVVREGEAVGARDESPGRGFGKETETEGENR